MKYILILILSIIGSASLHALSEDAFFFDRFIEEYEEITEKMLSLDDSVRFFKDKNLHLMHSNTRIYYNKAAHSADDGEFSRAFSEMKQANLYLRKTTEILERLCIKQHEIMDSIADVMIKIHANEDKIIAADTKNTVFIQKIREKLRESGYFCIQGDVLKSERLYIEARDSLNRIYRDSFRDNRYAAKLLSLSAEVKKQRKISDPSERLILINAEREIARAETEIKDRKFKEALNRFSAVEGYIENVYKSIKTRKEEEKRKSEKKDPFQEIRMSYEQRVLVIKDFLAENENPEIRGYLKEIDREMIRMQYADSVSVREQISLRIEKIFMQIDKKRREILERVNAFERFEIYLRRAREIALEQKNVNPELAQYIESLIAQGFDNILADKYDDTVAVVKKLSEKLRLISEKESSELLRKKELLEITRRQLENELAYFSSLRSEHAIREIALEASRIFESGKQQLEQMDFMKCETSFTAVSNMLDLCKKLKNP